MPDTLLRFAVPQLAPVWLDREATLARVVDTIEAAAREGAHAIAFGEAFVPGYPFWVSAWDGARFESAEQKALFAHYSDQAVTIEDGHLDGVCAALARAGMAAYLGIIERPRDRSGHSLYASYVFIGADGSIGSVHRKLCPTYEERLVWSPGDGHGLVVHKVGDFTLGGLNCWENWMPLARAALHAQGEDLHVMGWPGGVHNTHDLTPVLAKEGRAFTVSVGGMMARADVGEGVPFAADIRTALPDVVVRGGSCVAAPDGAWLLPPQTEPGLHVVELDPARVREARHNFDPSGHYSRPDVTELRVDRRRQGVAAFRDAENPT